MEVPARSVDQVFENTLTRGAVLITEMHFPSGTRKVKYLVVLNHDVADCTTLLFLTTSQTSYYDRFPHVDHLRIKPNTLPFFSKETILDCREVFSLEREDLKRRYRQATLKFVGILPQGYMDRIDRLVASSRFISMRHKKMILGWPS